MPTPTQQPLLPTTTTTTSVAGAPAILTRISAILALSAIAFWANYEASKSFDITIINSAASTRAGRIFDLKFVSNGRASRIIQYSSRSTQSILYPDDNFVHRKSINHVTLQLSSYNLTAITSMDEATAAGNYIINLSSSVASKTDAVDSALRRAVARLWLWDGQKEAPQELIEAMVDYLVMSDNFDDVLDSEMNAGLWSVAFLKYCEGKRSGFVAELNARMRDRWSESMPDEVLGSSVRRVSVGFQAAMGGRIVENLTVDPAEVLRQ